MDALTREDWFQLVERVFRPSAEDRALALLVDLPDARVPDRPAWAARRKMVAGWWKLLREGPLPGGLERVDPVFYRNARRENADLPGEARVHDGGEWPERAEQLEPAASFEEIFRAYRLIVAPTEFSATAPLKVAARRFGFRAATMPGFDETMIPALRLDWVEVDRRCRALKRVLDDAVAAHLVFEAGGERGELLLDLRHRSATASGGLLVEPGTAGNLPSGETYIVPYEGEIEGDASRSRGRLPLELSGELLWYRIEANRVVELQGAGPRAAAERGELAAEPAYANVAELGFGLLSAYGIRPVGRLLLDEKLGLHVAFGRSDHFGGSVGPADFRSPERVVHVDRVYIPEVQPAVRVVSVDLERSDGRRLPLMRDGAYAEGS